MKISPQVRALLLTVDALALVGVVTFSVLAALNSSQIGYIIGQIVCAAMILGSALLLNRGDATPNDE